MRLRFNATPLTGRVAFCIGRPIVYIEFSTAAHIWMSRGGAVAESKEIGMIGTESNSAAHARRAGAL
jgi:hypothetical protein